MPSVPRSAERYLPTSGVRESNRFREAKSRRDVAIAISDSRDNECVAPSQIYDNGRRETPTDDGMYEGVRLTR